MDNNAKLCIRGAKLFRPSESTSWVDEDLIISGSKFTTPYSPPEAIIAVTKNWILPGLIDCHVHLCGESVSDKARHLKYDEPKDVAIKRGINNALQCVKAGVTSVRDMGYRDRCGMLVREYFQKPEYAGPRVFSCGHLITGINGHGRELGVQASEAELSRAIKCELDAGVDHIKIINDPVYYSVEALYHAVSLVHNSGKPLACHAYTKKAVHIATAADADSLEHASGWYTMETTNSLYKNRFLVPTCVAAKDVISNPSIALVGLGEGSLSVFSEWWQDIQKNIPNTINLHMPIGIGTDSGFPPTTFGISVWREMEILHTFGMSWKDCFIATTQNNSKILQQPLLGKLSPGAYADFVVLSVDPLLEGAQSVNNIISVYVGGRCAYGKPLESLKSIL